MHRQAIFLEQIDGVLVLDRQIQNRTADYIWFLEHFHAPDQYPISMRIFLETGKSKGQLALLKLKGTQ